MDQCKDDSETEIPTKPDEQHQRLLRPQVSFDGITVDFKFDFCHGEEVLLRDSTGMMLRLYHEMAVLQAYDCGSVFLAYAVDSFFLRPIFRCLFGKFGCNYPVNRVAQKVFYRSTKPVTTAADIGTVPVWTGTAAQYALAASIPTGSLIVVHED